MDPLDNLVDVSVNEKGILIYRFHKNATISFEDAKLIVARASELVDSPRPSLVEIKGVKSIDKAARGFFSESPENKQVSSQTALVIGSAISKIIANLFISINKPTLPTRLFTSEEAALEWLEQFI